MAQEKSNVIGPGSVKQTSIDVPPLLGGADENYYAEILNPLTQDFIGRVASTKPAKNELRIVTNDNTPTITQTEEDIRRNYGLTLKNKDHSPKQHFVQTVTIKAGQTLRLQGNEAQVIVRQLVDVIMDLRDQQVSKGDPHARRQVEEEIVLKIGTMDEFLTSQKVDMRSLLNKEPSHAKPAQEESFSSETDADRDAGTPGNSRKGNLAANPSPGTGVNYQKAAV